MKEFFKNSGKGFAGVLLLFAIIIAAGILLTANMQTKQEYSFKELIPQTKAEMSSFALTLSQMTQNCDFTDAASCIDQNATQLLTQMDIGNTNNPIYCTVKGASKIGASPYYTLPISCSAKSFVGQNSISLDVNREITLPLQ